MADEANPQPRRWLAYGDPLRLLGAVAVVVVHAASYGTAQLGQIGRGDWWVCAAASAAGRWAVPAFVMLSGALLLDPTRAESPGEFYRRRCGRVGVPLLVWSVVYFWWRVWYKGETPSVGWMMGSLAFGTPYAHLFFLYLLAGLYAVTPFLRAALRGLERRQLAGVVALAFAVGVGDRLARTAYGVALSVCLLWVPYLGYYLAGWWLREVTLTRRQVRLTWLLWLACFGLTLGLTRLLLGGRGYERWEYYFIEYLSPNVIGLSLATWLLFAHHFRRARVGPVGRRLAELMLGVYLIHPALLAVFRDAGLTPDWHGALLGLPATVLAALLVSGLLTWVLATLPGLRRTVGL